MGAKCSFCSDNSRSGGGQTYPIPRSKYDKKQQNHVIKKSQVHNKILIPPLRLSQNIPLSYPHENYDQQNQHQLSLDFSSNEMLPIDVQELNLVINSISEQRPTPREVREHKDSLLQIQKQLHTQLTSLYERQIKLQTQNEYGVQGFKMHCIPKHDISTHLRSTQSSKQQQSSQKYSTPQKGCERSNIEEQICQENILRRQSDLKSKSSLSSQKVRYVNDMDQSLNTKFNKVVLKIEKLKIYPNKKYKNLAIKIIIPQNVAPEYCNNIYVSRTFKPQECLYFSETFILLFKDKSDICEKKLIIGLVEIGKNRKITKEIGHKHTFMIEQLVEGKIHDKELLVCPESHKNNQLIKQSQTLAYDSSLDYSKTKQTLIAKLNMKMQFIRNEEQTLQELIKGINQKLEEVQEAIEHIQILDQNNITNDQFYQQFFANDSQYSGNNLSQDISAIKQQVVQDDCIYPTSLLKQLDQIANEREIQNSNQYLQSEMQFYENQDVGTTLPDTYEKQKQPTYMQYSNDNYDYPNKQDLQDNAAFVLDQQNELKFNNQQYLGYQDTKNQANRKFTQRQINTAQKYHQRQNFNLIAMSEINLYSGVRDNNGHIRNSSSQEAGFYIAQHDLKGNKEYY